MPIALPAIKVALLGAESTGKTQLAHTLAAHLCTAGLRAIAIDEYLRQWCEEHKRTPQQHEQAHIAQVQRERIEAATQTHKIVIADTTPLMTAAYSEFIFQDTSMHESALAYQRSFDLTLLTGLDMPWQSDGIQRDGPHVREPVDALLRQRLSSAGIVFEVIYGEGELRTAHALQAIARISCTISDSQIAMDSVALHAEDKPATTPNRLKNWQSNCEKCSDPDCEHRLFSALFAR